MEKEIEIVLEVDWLGNLSLRCRTAKSDFSSVYVDKFSIGQIIIEVIHQCDNPIIEKCDCIEDVVLTWRIIPHILSSTGVYPNRPNPKGLPSMLQDYAKSSINIKKEKSCSMSILREKQPFSNWNKKRLKKDTKIGFLSQF